MAAVGIGLLQRLEHPVGAGGVVGPGQHRAAAGGLDGRGDLGFGTGDDDRADIGLDAAAPYVNDHRLAVNVGEGLARQAGRLHAGGNDDDGIGR